MGSEFKVGLFTILASMVLGYMFFVLSPDSFRSDGQVEYYSNVRDAAGVVKNSHVKTNGVTVGKVKNVLLQANQTRLEILVDKYVKVPKTSRLAIKEKGLLGDVFVEIIRGDDNGDYVEPKGLIVESDDQINISNLIAIAGSIGKDIKRVTATIADVLGTEQGKKDFAQIIEDTKLLISNTKELIMENRANVKDIVVNAQVATRNIRAISQTVNEILGSENKEKLENIIASFSNTMQDVEATAKNFRLVSDKVEKGEGTLGKLINKDDALNELEAAIKDVREILAPATRLQVKVDYHGEIRKDSDAQHFFNAYLQTRPDKFYLIGITDVNETTKETTVEPLNTPDDEISKDPNVQKSGVQRTRERIVENKRIRFNLQFGKRWHNLQMRFGLFETTGGLASDYYLFKDKMKFTLEAFDWNQKSYVRKTAHVKTYLTVLFSDHIYGIIGANDLTRYQSLTTKQGQPDYFIGAGLSFIDDDIKSLFGTAALLL